MSDSQSTFDGMLKQYYDREAVHNLVYNKNRFLTMVDKDTEFTGDTYKKGIIFGSNSTNSADATVSYNLSQVNDQQVMAWNITNRAKQYGFANWSRETMLASAANAGAFASVAKVNMDNKIRDMGNTLAGLCYRNGTGSQGTISSTVNGKTFSASGTQIQLSILSDVNSFFVGQQLDVSAVDGGAIRTEGSSNNGLIVTGVDRTLGILSFGFAVNDSTNGIPNIAAGDYLYVKGNAANGQTAVCTFGLESWIPAVSPGPNDSFWGWNRSVDTLLSGQRLNATDGRPLEEAIIEAADLVANQGGAVDTFFCSFSAYSRFLKEQVGRQLHYEDITTDLGISFRGLELHTSTGDAVIIPDRTCPANRIFGLQMDTWTMATLGDMVQNVNEDSLTMLRQTGADNFETRFVSYYQLVCAAPAYNVNIQIPGNQQT